MSKNYNEAQWKSETGNWLLQTSEKVTISKNLKKVKKSEDLPPNCLLSWSFVFLLSSNGTYSSFIIWIRKCVLVQCWSFMRVRIPVNVSLLQQLAPPSRLGPGMGWVHQMLLAAFIIEGVTFLIGTNLMVLCFIL